LKLNRFNAPRMPSQHDLTETVMGHRLSKFELKRPSKTDFGSTDSTNITTPIQRPQSPLRSKTFPPSRLDAQETNRNGNIPAPLHSPTLPTYTESGKRVTMATTPGRFTESPAPLEEGKGSHSMGPQQQHRDGRPAKHRRDTTGAPVQAFFFAER